MAEQLPRRLTRPSHFRGVEVSVSVPGRTSADASPECSVLNSQTAKESCQLGDTTSNKRRRHSSSIKTRVNLDLTEDSHDLIVETREGESISDDEATTCARSTQPRRQRRHKVHRSSKNTAAQDDSPKSSPMCQTTPPPGLKYSLRANGPDYTTTDLDKKKLHAANQRLVIENAVLTEDNVRLHDDIEYYKLANRALTRDLQQERKKHSANLTERGAKIKSIKDERNCLRDRVAVLQGESHELLSNHETTVSGLREEIGFLKQCLEECKDRIFRGQPFQAAPDTQLRSLYTNLCKDIDYWVYNQLDGIENIVSAESNIFNAEGKLSLMQSLMKDQERQFVQASLVLEIPLIVAIVTRLLVGEFLMKTFPGALRGDEDLLTSLVEGHRTLEPEKDEESIEAWRVEMYRSLQNHDRGKDMQKSLVENISQRILKTFGPLVAAASNKEFDQRACYQIIEAAAKLGNEIRQSSSRFSFETIFHSSDPVEKRVIFAKDCDRYTIIDSKTGCALRASTVPVPGLDGRVGEVLFTVHPALVRSITDEARKLTLVNATIVVKLDHMPERRTASTVESDELSLEM